MNIKGAFCLCNDLAEVAIISPISKFHLQQCIMFHELVFCRIYHTVTTETVFKRLKISRKIRATIRNHKTTNRIICERYWTEVGLLASADWVGKTLDCFLETPILYHELCLHEWYPVGRHWVVHNILSESRIWHHTSLFLHVSLPIAINTLLRAYLPYKSASQAEQLTTVFPIK